MTITEKPYFTLEILSDDSDVEALCELYWDLASPPADPEWPEFSNSLSSISKISGMAPKKIEKTAQEFSVIQINLWTCKECGKPYRTESRKTIEELSIGKKATITRPATYLCKSCENNQVEKQKLEKEKQDQEKRSLIRDFFNLSNGANRANPNELNLRQMVYFVSTVQAGASEDLQKISPLEIWEQKLSPSNDYSLKILESLLTEGLLQIHPETSNDSISKIDQSVGKYSYFPSKVTWMPAVSAQLPNSSGGLVQEILKSLASPWKNEAWLDEAYDLWFEIALEECKEFLVFQLNEHHFEFSPGEKTTDYLTYALKNFSVAQVFNLIWGSVQSGAALYQKGGISRKQAANTAVAAIQSKVERYAANKWDPKPFERNFSLGGSLISNLFYSVVLSLGDAGIKQKIDLEIIKRRFAQPNNKSSSSQEI